MALEEGDVEGSAIEGLVRLVAASSRFQARLGANNSIDPRTRIYWPWIQEELIEEQRPCAIIEDGEFDYDAMAGGGENILRPAGSLILTLVDNDRFAGQFKDSWRDFVTWQGCVIWDIAEKAGEDDYLDIVHITRLQKAMHSPPQNEPATRPYWHSKWEVFWSSRGGQ